MLRVTILICSQTLDMLLDTRNLIDFCWALTSGIANSYKESWQQRDCCKGVTKQLHAPCLSDLDQPPPILNRLLTLT